MKKELFIIGILTMSLTACYDQFDDTTSTTIPDAPEVYVDAHLIGDVKLLDESVINQFVIDVNDNSQEVQNGYINMNLDFVNELSQVIEVKTSTGDNGLAVMPIHRNATSYASIYLFPEYSSIADAGNNAFALDLTGLGIINGTSNLFNTSSSVTANYRTLTNEKLVNQLGHRGSGPAAEVWAIDIQSAFEFRFQNDIGSKVELSENSTVQLNLNQGILEDGDVLLQLDETLGIWEFIGDLGNSSVFDLKSSGFFAIAKYQEAAIIRSVLTLEDKPISFHSFTMGNDDLMVEVRSVSSGEWLALVPINEEIELSFVSPCGDNLESISFDPVSGDITLPAVEISGSENYFNISAEVIDCEGNNSSPAFILSNGPVQQTFAFMNTPDVFVPICDNELIINATNLESGEVGPSIDWDVSNDLSLDIISNCMSLQDGYAYVTIGEEEKILNDLLVTVGQNRTIFTTTDNTFKMSIDGTSVDAYKENEVNISINDDQFGPDGYFIACENSDLGCGITTCEMTHFAENDGDWYRVQFEGEIWVRTIDPPVASYKPIKGVILTRK